VLEDYTIVPGEKWKIEPQGTFYTVRLLEPRNAQPTKLHSTMITQTPAKTNYIEGPVIKDVRTSNWVVFYGEKGTMKTGVKKYRFIDVRPVSDIMVTNKAAGYKG